MQKRSSSIKMLKMHALSILRLPHCILDFENSTSPTKPDPNSDVPQQIRHDDEEDFFEEQQEFSFACNAHSICDFDNSSTNPTKPDPVSKVRQQIQHDDKEHIFEEQHEFSFASVDSQGTLIFADEIFDNGQIRPTFHEIDQIPLKKFFLQHHNNFRFEKSDISKELHIEPLQNTTLVEFEDLNEGCKKSNSTGFSKIWRFRRDLKFRSNINNNDTLILLNPPTESRPNKAKVENVKGRNTKNKMKSLAHEKFYVMNRMRGERNKRRSFLPYKQNLIGLFTNVNSLSRNIHPF